MEWHFPWKTVWFRVQKTTWTNNTRLKENQGHKQPCRMLVLDYKKIISYKEEMARGNHEKGSTQCLKISQQALSELLSLVPLQLLWNRQRGWWGGSWTPFQGLSRQWGWGDKGDVDGGVTSMSLEHGPGAMHSRFSVMYRQQNNSHSMLYFNLKGGTKLKIERQ